MLKHLRPHLILVSMLLGTVVAATMIAASPANALVAEGNVRQVICTDPGITVNVQYTNSTGNTTALNNRYLTTETRQGQRCITRDLWADTEYGEYVSTHVIAPNGGRVYCAIWENGQLVAVSEDDSDYYSYASCY